MKKITHLLFIVLSIMAVGACAPLTPTPQTASSTPTVIPNAPTTVNARLNENFVLRARQTGMITDTPDQFGILFYAVSQDSRCPQGMACVWAGEVRVQITFQEKGLVHPPVLELTTTPNDERHIIRVENYLVELVDVQPPRIADKPIAPEEYAATFRVTRIPETPTPAPNVTTLTLDQPVTLKMFQRVEIPDAQFRVTLNGVLEESRCPKQVNCVQAGRALMSFMAERNERIGFFGLSTSPPDGRTRGFFQGYVIELLKVQPYPETLDQKIETLDYSATIVIRKMTPPLVVQKNVGFVLKVGESAQIADESVVVKFARVSQDSRCPYLVSCAVRGNAIVEATLTEANGAAYTFILNEDDHTPNQRIPDNGLYGMALVALTPYPRGDTSSKEISQDEYEATFVVRKFASSQPQPTKTPFVASPTACLGLTDQDAQEILGVALVPAPAPDVLISPQFDDLANPIESRGLCGYISTALNLDSAPAIGMPRVISPTLAAYAITAARLTGAQIIELARIANMVRGATLDADSTPYLILKTRLVAGDWEGIFETFQELAKNSSDIHFETTDSFGDEGLWIWREARANNYAALLVRDKNSFVVMEALTVKTMQETAVQEAMRAAMAKVIRYTLPITQNYPNLLDIARPLIHHFAMQPANQQPNLAELARAWEQFVEHSTFAPDLDPLVMRSWQRTAPRLNPYGVPQRAYLSEDVLPRTLQQHAVLLALARPLMEDVYQFIEGAGALILLTDSTHCVLDELGDERVQTEIRGVGIQVGAFLDESRIGTNAFAVALNESSPAQIVGAEHFLVPFHLYSTVAAPIFDLDGSPLGVIGLIQRVDKHTPHALGIVVAAAKAIENQLSADLLMREANERASELNAALDAISDGVLVWNTRGIVTHLNDQAGQLLGLEPKLVVGRALNESLTLPEVLARATALGEDAREMETSFVVHDLARECFVSLRVLKNQEDAPNQFIATLRRTDQVRQLVTRMVGAQARLTLDDIVGNSPATRRVRKQALAAANAKGSVLLMGEEGTSKNALARAIHNSSKRAAGPFLAINCGALPRDLVLGEFLGFEQGAFNSQTSTGQPSKFELAEGGTLFLDQVDALPLEMQTVLVRVIEFAEVIRLGGTRVIPVDARVMASTEVDLERRLSDLSFRRDLYYRLSPIVISIPPLRERAEDIPVLVDRLLEKLSRQFGRTIKLASSARERLLHYRYPSNITELESIIERAALHCEGNLIKPEHLPPQVRERRAMVTRSGEPVRTMNESEHAAILAAGRAAQGNLSATARTLGIGRSTLWRKMKMLGLTLDDFEGRV